ncbi:MAG: hypothetical protein SF069_04575 [Phycisphaerae bacterium]|nr:hypothetical protein [Phycisphaerae bacterium]
MKRKVTKVSKTSHRRPAKAGKLVAKKRSKRAPASITRRAPKSPKSNRVAARKPKMVTARTEWGGAMPEIAGVAEGSPPDASTQSSVALVKRTKVSKSTASKSSRIRQKAAPRRTKKLTAPTSWGRLMLEFAGIIDGLPSDASINHDRYRNAKL